jgi:hypothetical protein
MPSLSFRPSSGDFAKNNFFLEEKHVLILWPNYFTAPWAGIH